MPTDPATPLKLRSLPVADFSISHDGDAHRHVITDNAPMFERLVHHEADAVGLLAYALYKQHKRDWLKAFETAHGRSAVLADQKAYALGERLPRRIAAYRAQAEALIAHCQNDAKVIPLQSRTEAALPAAAQIMASKRKQAIRYSLGMLLMVIAMAVAFRLAGSWLFGPVGR